MYGAVAKIAGASHTFQPQPEARTVTYLHDGNRFDVTVGERRSGNTAPLAATSPAAAPKEGPPARSNDASNGTSPDASTEQSPPTS